MSLEPEQRSPSEKVRQCVYTGHRSTQAGENVEHQARTTNGDNRVTMAIGRESGQSLGRAKRRCRWKFPCIALKSRCEMVESVIQRLGK